MRLFNLFKKKRNETKAIQSNSEDAKPSMDVNSSTKSTLNTKSVANQEIRGSNPIFPIAKYSKNAKKVYLGRDNPRLVYVFTYDQWLDLDRSEEHYLNIYFDKLTKKWVYGYMVSTIPGLSSPGWGFCEQYEISYDFVEEILKIMGFDEKIHKKIQAVMNNQI